MFCVAVIIVMLPIIADLNKCHFGSFVQHLASAAVYVAVYNGYTNEFSPPKLIVRVFVSVWHKQDIIFFCRNEKIMPSFNKV